MRSRSVVYTLPTGGGKTVIFAEISRLCHEAGTEAVIMVHRDTLLQQASDKLRDIDVLHSIIAPGRTDFGDRIKIASVQTLVRRIDRHKFKLYIIDEGHHAVAGSYRKIIDADPDASILLVTATPMRMDGRGLGEVAQELIVGPSIRELMDDGYLTEAISYGASHIVDMARARTTAGDYNSKDVESIMDNTAITGDAVEHYKKLCHGVPAIAFCATVKHAHDVADGFRRNGYRSEAIDGKMPAQLIRDRLKGLANGSIQIITSCDLISEGFDAPAVVAGILLRPTKSLAVYMQQVGRMLRPVFPAGIPIGTREERLAAIAQSGKPRAIILDHAGNAFRHGLADESREWTLESRKKKQAENVGMKACPNCFAYCRPWDKQCKTCGHIFIVVANEREINTVDGELTQLSALALGRLRRRELSQARTYKDLLEIARKRGYWPGWAYKMWIQRGGAPGDAR
jgi:superfamily II DNA or RNA helicase